MAGETVTFREGLTVGMRVNGQPMVSEVAAGETLLDWLRERAGLAGTKKGARSSSTASATTPA